MATAKTEPKKDEKAKTDGAEAAPKKSRAGLFAGLGALAFVGLGFLAATMAVPAPKKKHIESLEGPFVAKLSKGDIQVNLAGESSKRYLVMALNAEYFAYDEMYVMARLGLGTVGGEGEVPKEDPLYTAMLKDAILNIAGTKTRDQVTDATQIESFLEEVRKAVDPILFPVCVGDAHAQGTADSKSKVKMGESGMSSTLRGLLHEHFVYIEGAEKLIRFDDGPGVKFEGDEHDLRLVNLAGECVYLDVSHVEPEFEGKVAIGAPGRVRRIYREQFLVQ